MAKKWLVVNEETGISHQGFDDRKEAERSAKEMTEYHERKYVVRESIQATKDCLGRPIREDGTPDPPRTRILSDDQITDIANDVRTKPLAEVGRHVMPLIQHIVASEERECRTCQHWIPYNHVEASRGECLVHQSPEATVKIQGEEPAALLTPFDWSCKGWRERAKQECDAMQSSG